VTERLGVIFFKNIQFVQFLDFYFVSDDQIKEYSLDEQIIQF